MVKRFWISLMGVAMVILGGCGAPPPATAPVDAGATSAATPVALSADLSVRQVQPGAFVITHAFPWPANALLVEMPNGDLVLVDTPYTPEATVILLDWIKTQFGERKIIAFNTGFHVDNLGGNSALIERGIPVYGSEQTVRLLAERGPASRALMVSWLGGSANARYREGHAAVPYVPPTHLFSLAEGLALTFGEETVEVYYPGPTHTDDNVVVYFPRLKLLFGGCMILAGDEIGNTADADMAAWPESVKKLSRFGATTIVPGHGDRLDAGLLENTLALLAKGK